MFGGGGAPAQVGEPMRPSGLGVVGIATACWDFLRNPGMGSATRVFFVVQPFLRYYVPQAAGFMGFGSADQASGASSLIPTDHVPSSPQTSPSSFLMSMLNGAMTNGGGSATSGGSSAYARVDAQIPAQPHTSPSKGGGRRKALLVGINYEGSPNALGGCLNDTKFMSYCLEKNFGYAKDDFVFLNEEAGRSNRRLLPTRANMLREMARLVSGCQAGDRLFFHFSGHGSQEPCPTPGEEADGMNETILPLDFERCGTINDDEIYRILIDPLPTGVLLTCIFDSCHSGTISDLPYAAVLPTQAAAAAAPGSDFRWLQVQPRVQQPPGGGEAICISGCEEHDTSADTSALSGGVARTGACTYAFVQAVEENARQDAVHLTYGRLLERMRGIIENANARARDGGGVGGGAGSSNILAAALPALAELYADFAAKQRRQGGGQRASSTGVGGLGEMLMSAMLTSVGGGGGGAGVLTQKPQLCASHLFALGHRLVDL